MTLGPDKRYSNVTTTYIEQPLPISPIAIPGNILWVSIKHQSSSEKAPNMILTCVPKLDEKEMR
jgi:hypothetical protein